MAPAKQRDPDKGEALLPDPGDEIVHVQPKPGVLLVYRNIAYGEYATLQVPRRDLDRIEGAYVEVDPAKLPDVGELPPAA